MCKSLLKWTYSKYRKQKLLSLLFLQPAKNLDRTHKMKWIFDAKLWKSKLKIHWWVLDENNIMNYWALLIHNFVNKNTSSSVKLSLLLELRAWSESQSCRKMRRKLKKICFVCKILVGSVSKEHSTAIQKSDKWSKFSNVLKNFFMLKKHN